jgi:hypothetical protein
MIKSWKNITVKITRANGEVEIIRGKNLVTDEGDIYYAQKVVGETTDFPTPFLRLGTSDVAPEKDDTDVNTYITDSAKAVDTGFPKRNNTDPGNTGGGVNTLTWKITYALGDLDTTGIQEGAIVDDGASPTKAICHFLFDSSFDVASSDQLTVYVNHTFTGV